MTDTKQISPECPRLRSDLTIRELPETPRRFMIENPSTGKTFAVKQGVMDIITDC